jgi:glycosyltransferase involved in cell wall biosynthesis
MPLYNKAPYVGKAVESVLAQTWGEWELVVVDDGSKDGSGDIVLKYNDPRIRLHRQENAGVSVARNTGVAMATAPYVCFLDADDWWEPTFLAEMSGLIDRHPDAGIYGTAYYMVKNSQQRPAPIGFDEGFTEGEINYCQVYSRTLCMPLWTGAVCMPKRVFEAEGGFKPGLKLGEDFVLWVHTALKHKVVMLNRQLSNYNQDVDIAWRGTHRVHPPEHHMLWHVDDLELHEQSNPDYKLMIDSLRTYSMQFYITDRRYRKQAREMLKKVDWSRQPKRMQRLYSMPAWLITARYRLMTLGSKIKQQILHTR